MIIHQLLAYSLLLVAGMVGIAVSTAQRSPLRTTFGVWSGFVAAVGIYSTYREPLLWEEALCLSLILITLSLFVAHQLLSSQQRSLIGYAAMITVVVGSAALYRYSIERRRPLPLTMSNVSHAADGTIPLPSPLPADAALSDKTDLFPVPDSERDAVWHQPSLTSFVTSHQGQNIREIVTYSSRTYLLLGSPFIGSDGSSLESLTLTRE